MQHWSQLAVTLVAVGLMAAGCASPDVADDDEPLEEPDVEDQQEPVDEADEPVDEADEPEISTGVIGLVAVAEMQSGEQEQMGEVEFTQTEQGVEVEGRLESLEPGPRGFHVHEFGECDPPDFETAGGHFNPLDAPHGGPDETPDERHAGDFGNIEFDEDGVAEFSFVDDTITLGEGVNDIVGQALIVHYEEDDLETEPTGDAGPRAGCAIIEAVREDVE